MGRPQLYAAAGTITVLAIVGLWVFAAEARGALPSGTFTPLSLEPWPVTEGAAASIRNDALERAAVRLSYAEPVSLAHAADPLAEDGPLTCRYLHDEPSGTSAKFNCVLDGGAVVKVKYNRNSEIHAEVAATRLVSALGFPADEMTIVPRLRCYGCPRFPFLATQVLWYTRSFEALAPHGYDDAYTDFEWVAVERRFNAPAIETPEVQGWAWWEVDRIKGSSQADLDALRLLAVFIAHWDNKSENQRLVCLDERPAAPDRHCARPLAMMQDLGSTFGPSKVNLAQWSDMPVWRDRRRCEVSMTAYPFEGATFAPVEISEEGRQQLARQLATIPEEDVRRLFADARFPEFQSGTDDERDLEAWVRAFRGRVDQIVSAGPCSGSRQSRP
jgi:hypothetical protein